MAAEAASQAATASTAAAFTAAAFAAEEAVEATRLALQEEEGDSEGSSSTGEDGCDEQPLASHKKAGTARFVWPNPAFLPAALRRLISSSA